MPLPNADTTFCGACANRSLYFDRALVPFLFAQFVRDAVHQFKYNDKLNYGKLLSQLLLQHIQRQDIAIPELLVPVPLHPKRLRKRGFNQALEIARVLSKGVHSPISYKEVRRIRKTSAQTGLSANKRYRNVRNAFAVQASETLFKGCSVAIIDDVMTTGSTVNEVARCLRWAGAEKIQVWCVARSKIGS